MSLFKNKLNEYIWNPCFNKNKGLIKYLNAIEIIDCNAINDDNYLLRALQDEGIIYKKIKFETYNKFFNKILIIEPHIDDFAISASGYTIEKLFEGNSCHVLNIFSKTSINNFPWKGIINLSNKEYEKLRLKEANFAIKTYLKQVFTSLELESSSIKNKLNTSSNHEVIVKKVEKLVKEEKIETLLCPMAISHKDHLTSYLATIDVYSILKKDHPDLKLILYEDYPYALNKIRYIRRMKEIRAKIVIKEFYCDTSDYLDEIVNLITMYKSQFDDINRKQMLAIMREIFRAISSESEERLENNDTMSQRYWEVLEVL
jgi:LmbE family N-acetylglucosaminyl deacetylase